MEARFVILFSVLAAAANASSSSKIKMGFARPSLRLAIEEKATFQCCYEGPDTVNVSWIKSVMISINSTHTERVNKSERAEITTEVKENMKCVNLILKDITLNDTGLYQCTIQKDILTAGTFLQVYVPIQMILNINERSKNSIITAEGVLLLLVVLLPGFMLICKSKSLNELDKRRCKEEENIYEGLNLDDCNSTYHQIQRSLVQGPYQDVINNDDEDIQLEKP